MSFKIFIIGYEDADSGEIEKSIAKRLENEGLNKKDYCIMQLSGDKRAIRISGHISKVNELAILEAAQLPAADLFA